MKISPYLNFNGDCAVAFKFYEQILGGTIVMIQTHGESAMKDHVAPEWHDKILHVQLDVDGHSLIGSDAPSDRYSAPHGMQVSLTVKSAPDGERIFQALSENGQIAMPYQQTFWSPGFGTLVDRFGIPWMVNCEPASATAAAGQAGA
jgi:PhnB protein